MTLSARHNIEVPNGPTLSVMDLAMADAHHAAFEAVISLVDPGTELGWVHPRHHVFWVDDVEHPWRSTPSADFVSELLSLELEGLSSVLIHCHGGYSRSPAAAMLWAKKLGATMKAIERGIDWHEADPNRLILALGEAQLGLERPMLSELAWRRTGRRHPLVMLPLATAEIRSLPPQRESS